MRHICLTTRTSAQSAILDGNSKIKATWFGWRVAEEGFTDFRTCLSQTRTRSRNAGRLCESPTASKYACDIQVRNSVFESLRDGRALTAKTSPRCSLSAFHRRSWPTERRVPLDPRSPLNSSLKTMRLCFVLTPKRHSPSHSPSTGSFTRRIRN